MRSFLKGGIVFIVVLLFGVLSSNAQISVSTKAGSKAPALGSKCAKNGLTDAEITGLLASHNNARTVVKTPLLVWDCKLADMAQRWAAKGVAAHRPDPMYGENIFVASNPAIEVDSVLKRWMAEQPNWTNATGTCAAGKVCTHYTQVIWKSTTHVGCGINRNATGKWKVLLVCNYDPQGNTGGPAF